MERSHQAHLSPGRWRKKQEGFKIKLQRLINCLLASTVVLSAIYPGLSQAGGIHIPEMSNVSESGYAGAGMVARANDAGTVFTNPAGMPRFSAKRSSISPGICRDW